MSMHWKLALAPLVLAGCFTGVFGSDYTPLFCTGDTDCATGQRCLRAKVGSECVTPEKASCADGRSCPDGTSCVNGTCRTVCLGAASLPCLNGQSCEGSSCVNKTDPAHDPTGSAGAAGSPGSGGFSGTDNGGGAGAPGGAAGQAGGMSAFGAGGDAGTGATGGGAGSGQGGGVPTAKGEACTMGVGTCASPSGCTVKPPATNGICSVTCASDAGCGASVDLRCVQTASGYICLRHCAGQMAVCAQYGHVWVCQRRGWGHAGSGLPLSA